MKIGLTFTTKKILMLALIIKNLTENHMLFSLEVKVNTENVHSTFQIENLIFFLKYYSNRYFRLNIKICEESSSSRKNIHYHECQRREK